MIGASLIFNRNAGRAKSHGITTEYLVRRFHERGIEIAALHIDRIEEVPDLVESLAPGSLLIIAGGDGTVYEAVQVPACRQLTLGLIPLGTANNLAVSAGIPLDIADAVEAVAFGRERLVDLGIANDRVFTQAAGVGFHAEAFRRYGEHKARDVVRGTEVVLSLVTSWHPCPMRISIDDEPAFDSDAVQVTIANTPYYGQRHPIAPDASIDDGLLDLAEIIGCRTRLELAGCVMEFMEGRELEPSKVRRARGKRIEITPSVESALPAHADAEPIGYAPVTIEVMPSCLRLLVPR